MIENVYISLLIAIAAGVLSIYFVKPVVIITTSVAGAGIIISSAYLMMKLNINESPVITAILWIPIAVTGIIVQYITAKKRNREKRRNMYNQELTFSEIRYPGMQRAYRNFCIKCGYGMFGSVDECPRCGYSYDD